MSWYICRENSHEVENLNWEGRLEKIKGTLELWRMRNLTLYGKVICNKTFSNCSDGIHCHSGTGPFKNN